MTTIGTNKKPQELKSTLVVLETKVKELTEELTLVREELYALKRLLKSQGLAA